MAQWRPACDPSRWESEMGGEQKLEAREGYVSSSRPGWTAHWVVRSCLKKTEKKQEQQRNIFILWWEDVDHGAERNGTAKGVLLFVMFYRLQKQENGVKMFCRQELTKWGK